MKRLKAIVASVVIASTPYPALTAETIHTNVLQQKVEGHAVWERQDLEAVLACKGQNLLGLTDEIGKRGRMVDGRLVALFAMNAYFKSWAIEPALEKEHSSIRKHVAWAKGYSDVLSGTDIMNMYLACDVPHIYSEFERAYHRFKGRTGQELVRWLSLGASADDISEHLKGYELLAENGREKALAIFGGDNNGAFHQACFRRFFKGLQDHFDLRVRIVSDKEGFKRTLSEKADSAFIFMHGYPDRILLNDSSLPWGNSAPQYLKNVDSQIFAAGRNIKRYFLVSCSTGKDVPNHSIARSIRKYAGALVTAPSGDFEVCDMEAKGDPFRLFFYDSRKRDITKNE